MVTQHSLASRLQAIPRFSLAPVVLVGLMLFGFGLRMLNFTNPPLDFAAWRELRSACIARGFYYEMNPQFDAELRQKAINLGTTFETLEPTILERLVAVTYTLIGGEALWVARLYNILFWMIGGWALYDLLCRIQSRKAALAGLAVFLLMPFGVQASRAFMPDPGMVVWIVITMNFLSRWMEEQNWRWAFLTGIAGGMAILVKVFAVYMVAPTSVLMVLTCMGIKKAIRSPKVWAAAAIMGMIPAAYYFIGIPGLAGTYIDGWVVGFSGLLTSVRFYFRWVDYLDDLYGLAFVFLAVIGVFTHGNKGKVLSIGLWLGYAAYGMSVPSLIITHPYYNLVLVPIMAFSIAPLLEAMLNKISEQPYIWQWAAAAAVIVTVAYPCWLTRNSLVAKDYSLEPVIWQRIGESLPQNASFIGLTHDYNTRLKYYGWTSVTQWPHVEDMEMNDLGGGNSDVNDPAWIEIFKEKTDDYDYFIVTLMNELDEQPVLKQILFNNYPYTEGDGYYLFDLKHPLTDTENP